MLDRPSPATRSSMVIRVLGGTVSQTTTSADWSDSAVAAWVAFQVHSGVEFIFIVNGNDSPESQRAFYDRWVAAGAHFSFIEMMNEYYLRKYLDGDTTEPDVTMAVSPDDYVTAIVPAYGAVFADTGLPIFIILAPAGETPALQMQYEQWNATVIAALAAHSGAPIGVTLHLYSRDSSFDYDQIDRIRARLPAGTPIAVTESGILDPTVMASDGYPDAAYDHLLAIYTHLQPGDYLLDQVLYKNGSGWQPADLHADFSGVTPKGERVLDFFETNVR
ncbi:MAG: hypothetical protein IPK60_25740 [Sandaracinaceae bacterium]|nr:hypothetical protein [Sandaracinaceae bacterium]